MTCWRRWKPRARANEMNAKWFKISLLVLIPLLAILFYIVLPQQPPTRIAIGARPQNNSSVILLLISLVPTIIASIPLYFLPTIIASIRRHRNRMAIGALNLLLGWTVIGWVAALVWAFIADVEPKPSVHDTTAPDFIKKAE